MSIGRISADPEVGSGEGGRVRGWGRVIGEWQRRMYMKELSHPGRSSLWRLIF